MPEAIQIIEEKRNGIAVMRVKNVSLLDPQLAESMTKLLVAAFDSGELKILLNLANVSRMSSLFFRAFIVAGKKAKEKKAVMAFCNVSPTIKSGFDMMGLGSYFTTYPTESNAFEKM